VAKMKKGDKSSTRTPEERYCLENPGVDTIKRKQIGNMGGDWEHRRNLVNTVQIIVHKMWSGSLTAELLVASQQCSLLW
jgi:hypothetical protein